MTARPDTGGDPGGRLQDILDPDERRRVAKLRGTRGQAKQAQAKASRPSGDATGQGAKGDARSRMAALLGERAADVHALQALIDAPGTLGSDRIRAIEAKQRILGRAEEEEREERYGGLVALRSALSALPEGERLSAVSGLLAVEGDERSAQGDALSATVEHDEGQEQERGSPARAQD